MGCLLDENSDIIISIKKFRQLDSALLADSRVLEETGTLMTVLLKFFIRP